MRKIISLTLLLPLLLSCGHGGYRATLNHIDTLLRTDPNTALTVIDSLSQYESNMSRAERMRTRLYRGVARIRTYNPVTDDSTATAIARYYDSHGTPNDRMMAYYLLGCTYRDLGDTPMQLECLQKAAESADTTRNDCDYYTMSSIYGHLANLYHKQVLPEEELKALKVLGECAKKDNDTISFLQSFELQMRAYTLSKEIDKVLCIADSARKNYKYLGYDNMAATLLITPISLYLDRADYKKAKDGASIKKKSNNYLLIFTILTVGFMLLAPDVFKILAPEPYWSGLNLIPLVSLAYYFNFLYSFPANYEFYNEKRNVIAMGSTVSAVLNIVLNFLFIPKYAGIGAAIATLISYISMFLIHELNVRLILKAKDFEYSLGFYLKGLFPVVCTAVFYYFVMDLWIVRWLLALILGACISLRIIKNKEIL